MEVYGKENWVYRKEEGWGSNAENRTEAMQDPGWEEKRGSGSGSEMKRRRLGNGIRSLALQGR